MKTALIILVFITGCTATQTINTDDLLAKYVGQNIETVYAKLGTPSRIVKLSDSTSSYIYEKSSLSLNTTSNYYKPSGVYTSDESGNVYRSGSTSLSSNTSSTLRENSQVIEFFVSPSGIIKNYHYSGLPKQFKVSK